jgi:hypothetical protein
VVHYRYGDTLGGLIVSWHPDKLILIIWEFSGLTTVRLCDTLDRAGRAGYPFPV